VAIGAAISIATEQECRHRSQLHDICHYAPLMLVVAATNRPSL
jgi:hypothetical protein